MRVFVHKKCPILSIGETSLMIMSNDCSMKEKIIHFSYLCIVHNKKEALLDTESMPAAKLEAGKNLPQPNKDSVVHSPAHYEPFCVYLIIFSH